MNLTPLELQIISNALHMYFAGMPHVYYKGLPPPGMDKMDRDYISNVQELCERVDTEIEETK
jgi:hypothetical protein